MSRKSSFLFLVFAVIVTTNIFAQGETAVPFLLINPSPNLNGMAGAFNSLPTDDIYGSYYNPAQLGNFSRNKNLSIGFFLQKTDWLPQFNYRDLTLQTMVVAGGYKLQTELPIYFGVSLMYEKLNLGENVWTDAAGNQLGVFNSFETFHALSAGIGIDHFLRYNFGITIKYINSELVPINIIKVGKDYKNGIARTVATDIGLQVELPVISTIESLSNQFTSDVKPFLNISSGYSINNIGDELGYINKTQKDPLPRQARLGYGISFGLQTNQFDDLFNLIKFDISSEARDILVDRENGKINYQGLTGDINIIHNVINGISDEKVMVYQGWRVNVFETFQFSKGRFRGHGYWEIQKTGGISVSLSGLFKFLRSQTNESGLEFLAKHVDLQYAYSEYNVRESPLDATEFEGIQISLFGFY